MVSDGTSVHAPQSHSNVLLSLLSSKCLLHILSAYISYYVITKPVLESQNILLFCCAVFLKVEVTLRWISV